MRRDVAAFLAGALALLALALGLGRPDRPAGQEAGAILQAASLWSDRDLNFDERDLARGYRMWPQGPAGLELAVTDENVSPPRFVEPWPMTFLLALAWPALGTSSGPVVATCLFLLILVLGARAGNASPLAGPGAAALGARHFVLLGVFGSLLLSAALRGEPVLLPATLAVLAVEVWRRLPGWGSAASAGFLLGLGAAIEPRLAVLLLPVGGMLWSRAQGKGLLAAAAGVAAGAGLFLGGQWVTGGQPFVPEAAVVRVFETGFPGEAHPASQGQIHQGLSGRSAAVENWPRRFVEVLAGRSTGWLVVAPGLLFAGLALLASVPRRRGGYPLREHSPGTSENATSKHSAGTSGGAWWWWVHGAAFLVLLVLEMFLPQAWGRWGLVAVAPAWMILLGAGSGSGAPGRLEGAAQGAALLATAAAFGLWTLPTGLSALGLAAAQVSAPRLLLPLELTTLDRVPGLATVALGETLWVVPEASAHPEERHPDGIWLVGSNRSEVIVVSPRPLAVLEVRVSALSEQGSVRLRSRVAERFVRFDSVEKRAGTPVSLPLPASADARDLGRFFPAGEHYYRLILDAGDGVVPRRRVRRSQDGRYLGVFLAPEARAVGEEEP